MRSIQSSFTKVQKRNPYTGDFICLAEAVEGRGFSRRSIREALKKIIDEDDYDAKDLNKLITHLHILSNVLVDDHFDNKIALLELEILPLEQCVKLDEKEDVKAEF